MAPLPPATHAAPGMRCTALVAPRIRLPVLQPTDVGARFRTAHAHEHGLGLSDEGPEPISDPSDVPCVQLPAARNCSTTSALMRPRALTSIPRPLAQARTAAGS